MSCRCREGHCECPEYNTCFIRELREPTEEEKRFARMEVVAPRLPLLKVTISNSYRVEGGDLSTTGPTLVSAVQAFQKEWRKKHKDTDAYAVLPEDTDECFYVLSGTSFSDILAMTKFWWGKKFREENLRITIAEFNNISEDGISSYSSSCLCVEYPSRARIQP